MTTRTNNSALLRAVALAAGLLAANAHAGVLSGDLSVTIDDGISGMQAGDGTTYTVVVANAGPNDITGITVANTLPTGLTCTWTCSASAGSSCTANGSGGVNDTVDLLNGGSATFTASCTTDNTAANPLVNTVTVSSAAFDPDSLNNTATDSNAMTYAGPVAPAEPVPVLGAWGLLTLAGGLLFAGLRQGRRRLLPGARPA